MGNRNEGKESDGLWVRGFFWADIKVLWNKMVMMVEQPCKYIKSHVMLKIIQKYKNCCQIGSYKRTH